MGSIDREIFGTLPNGGKVEVYKLTNKNGIEAKIMTYGGTIVSLKTLDRYGNSGDIVLGFDTFAPYLRDSPYFGSLIGRYANRIKCGSFMLDNKVYQLDINNGINHLHGGKNGFDKVMWKAYPSSTSDTTRLRMTYLSHDNEEGYPGNVSIEVSYTLTDTNELIIHYEAITDSTTIINLTNHTYFNLAEGGSILDHILQINADNFLPVDETLIPTGEFRFVENTPMDFIHPIKIGININSADEQLEFAGGYDHNWILKKAHQPNEPAAIVSEPKTGRMLKVYTSQPGLQFYSGNFLNGSIRGKGGVIYNKHAGFCLETQHYPDSPNNAAFPSTVLQPKEVYKQTTTYAFDVLG